MSGTVCGVKLFRNIILRYSLLGQGASSGISHAFCGWGCLTIKLYVRFNAFYV